MAINIEIRVYHDTGDTSSNPAAAQAGCTATCISYYSGTKTYTGGHPKPGESGGTTSVAYTNYQLTATPATGWYFKGWDVITRNYVTGGLDSQGNVRTDVEIQTERTYHSGTNPYPANTTATDYEFPGDLAEANPGYDWQRHTFKWEIIAVYAQFEQGTPPPPTYTITTAVSPSGAGTTTGDGTYNSGASCTLTATPASGYSFVRWEKNGTQVSTSASYTFTVSESATYTAVFEATVQMYHVQVVAFKSQAYVSLNGSPGDDIQSAWTVAEGDFEYGESITIAATPKEPTLRPFKAWYRDPYAMGNPEQTGTLVPGAGATYTTTVTADVVYFAVFNDLSNFITVETYADSGPDREAPDAVVTINGQGDGDNDYSLAVATGSTVTIQTTAYGGLDNWDDPLYFVHWSYENPDTSEGSIVSDDLTYTFQSPQEYSSYYYAEYLPHYILQTSVSPAASAGSIALSPSSRYGNNLYADGTSVTLTATASTGYVFDRWEKDGVVVSRDAAYTFTCTIQTVGHYIAYFAPEGKYLVTVKSSPDEGGVVTGGGYFAEGEYCTIEATPNDGYRFTGWTSSEGESEENAVYTFSVSSDVVWTAHFELIPPPPTFYQVTTSANPIIGGVTSGDGSYESGTSCTIVANANAGYLFDHWEINGSTVAGAAATYTFTVTGSANCVAFFEEESESSSSDSSEEWEDGPLLYNPLTGHLRYNPETNHLRYKRRLLE